MKETLSELKQAYEKFKMQNISLNMERGWPCQEQLELSLPMLDLVTSHTNLCLENDYRGYAGTGGIAPLKKLIAEVLQVSEEQIYIGGTMSTTIMYDLINKAVVFGFDGFMPWKDFAGGVKFLCPSPGYEKHFNICKTFGIEMVQIPMNDFGPDMDLVEELVKNDDSVKGIWCVPLYSNPTGIVYSDETVRRLARMETKAEDFRIIWDNAYCVHHLTDEKCRIINIIDECRKCGHPDRVFEFTSTSKITFPGGGVGVCASSIDNIKWLTQKSLLQLKSGDKINQLRHAMFFPTVEALDAHMKKHRDIIKPKFDLVDRILHEQLDEWNIAAWINPKGGYFINIKLLHGMAHDVWERCKEAGVNITPAGSTFPYGDDKEDAYLRIAPTYPSLEDLDKAMHLLCTAIKLSYLENNLVTG